MRNDYEIRGDITAIFLKRKDGTILETLISTSDLMKAKKISTIWSTKWDKVLKSHYVQYRITKDNGKDTTNTLHRYLLDNPEGKVVDHINHDTLDNTRKNLRVITQSQNCQNRKTKNNNSSGVRGVNFHKRTGKWAARVKINGKLIHLGIFDNIEDAEKTVVAARKKIMPFSMEVSS